MSMKMNGKDVMVIVTDANTGHYGETGKIIKQLNGGKHSARFVVQLSDGENILAYKWQLEYAAPWSCDKNDVVEFVLGHTNQTTKLGVVNRRLSSQLAEILSDDGKLYTMHVNSIRIVGRQIGNTLHHKSLMKERARKQRERALWFAAAVRRSAPQSQRKPARKEKPTKTNTVGNMTFTY